MAKPIKTFIKIKGTDFKYEASTENATYAQMVKHYLRMLTDKVLTDELKRRGFEVEKATQEGA